MLLNGIFNIRLEEKIDQSAEFRTIASKGEKNVERDEWIERVLMILGKPHRRANFLRKKFQLAFVGTRIRQALVPTCRPTRPTCISFTSTKLWYIPQKFAVLETAGS